MGWGLMIITPHNCIYYESHDNLNKTCKLKNKRCVLITDQKQCCKFTVRRDLGFWNSKGEYVEDIQEINKMDMDKYFEELNDMANLKGFGEKPETEEIIIDGVNVEDCSYYNKDNYPYCCEVWDNECEAQNCYYKQLQRLQQENADLKKCIERMNEPVVDMDIALDYAELKAENEAYKSSIVANLDRKISKRYVQLLQTLQEIKEIAEEISKEKVHNPDIDIILQKISDCEA